ncbi:class I SAM-dependent DNA methyltransferase [Aerococcaceae bacterium WGS1372]
MSFSQIADVYDRFNDLSVYEYWVDFTLNSLNRKPQKMLDVACGTGWFTQLMSPFVDHITAIDIDEDMLAIARQEVGPVDNIEFIYGDMTELQPYYEQFELVSCYLDSLCFLDDFESVSKALDEMYKCLAPGGVLLFDVWTPNQIINNFDGFEYFDQDDKATLIWESAIDEDQLAVTHYLTVYQQEDVLYRRTEVQLNERTYRLDQYLQALQQAGFNKENIEVLVDYGHKYYDSKTDTSNDRWFFRCSK